MPAVPCTIHRGLSRSGDSHPLLSKNSAGRACGRGSLQCRAGILDAYRAEKGQAPAKPTADFPQRQQKEREQQHQPSGQEEGEEEGVCTAQCVREVTSEQQFDSILTSADPNTLVVVDFYRTACGSCKYISAGFLKLCKGSHEGHAPVEFLKHNVFDEYEEPSEVAERLHIKVVPSFYFYKNSTIVEQFATRDKAKIAAAINKHVGHDVV